MIQPTLARIRIFVLIFSFALAAAVTACSAAKPTVIISSPPSGSQYNEGDEIKVQSTATDSSGVDRVELIVDGIPLRTDPSPSPQVSFTVIQSWKATQGAHVISVRAYNKSGGVSDVAAISLNVAPATVAQSNTPTPIPSLPIPTVPPPPVPGITPTVTPTGAPSGTCVNNAAFIADVTIPDGMTIAAGQTFNKTWRLSNNGTCTWTAYEFTFVSGEAMTAGTIIAVPSLAPGGTVDVTVPMTAPAAPGPHSGNWRMRSNTGATFGTTVRVLISVPGAVVPTAVPPTNTPPPSGCTGAPVIASFSATATTITVGNSTTLQWGAVTNADSVEIDHSIGGVASPGNLVVSPATTTTYTMTARCGATTAIRQVTITVNPLAPPAAPAMTSPSDGKVFRVFPRVASFSWNSVAFPGGVSYTIEIQKNTGSWVAHVTAGSLGATNYSMAAFPGDNQGRWRVWATSPTAGAGTKSDWRYFSFNTSASQYAGTWLNDDAATSGITKVIITSAGQTLTVHPYGKCHPSDCDWGTANKTLNTSVEPITVSGFSSAGSNSITITLNNDAGTSLRVVYNNLGITYYFHK
ncbi:MAG: hypothetical protein HY868_13165 [Chloroflexi bacterium]|nr:hypothetical protein [Chloroflexota bacterium]